MPRKTSFCKEFQDLQEPIKLTYAASKDNSKQEGADLEKFVTLVNAHKDKITELVYLDTTYLHRHYDNKYSNVAHAADTYKKNKSTLDSLTVKVTVQTWHTLVHTAEFSEIYKKILLDYEGDGKDVDPDPQFAETVKRTADDLIHIGSKKARVKFLLEECAGALLLTGYVTYPGPFNAAISYAMQKHKKGAVLLEHTIGKPLAAENNGKREEKHVQQRKPLSPHDQTVSETGGIPSGLWLDAVERLARVDSAAAAQLLTQLAPKAPLSSNAIAIHQQGFLKKDRTRAASDTEAKEKRLMLTSQQRSLTPPEQTRATDLLRAHLKPLVLAGSPKPKSKDAAAAQQQAQYVEREQDSPSPH